MCKIELGHMNKGKERTALEREKGGRGRLVVSKLIPRGKVSSLSLINVGYQHKPITNSFHKTISI